MATEELDGYMLITINEEVKQSEMQKMTAVGKMIFKRRIQIKDGLKFLARAGKRLKRVGDKVVLYSPAASGLSSAATVILPSAIGLPLSASSAILESIADYVQKYDEKLSDPIKKAFGALIEQLEFEPGLEMELVEQSLQAEPVKIDAPFNLEELQKMMSDSPNMPAEDFIRRLGFSKKLSDVIVKHLLHLDLELEPLEPLEPVVSDMIGQCEDLHKLLWDII